MGIESSTVLGGSMDEWSPGGAGLLGERTWSPNSHVAVIRRNAEASARGGRATLSLGTGRAKPKV